LESPQIQSEVPRNPIQIDIVREVGVHIFNINQKGGSDWTVEMGEAIEVFLCDVVVVPDLDGKIMEINSCPDVYEVADEEVH
jgi:uncharacterized protein YbbK (DUF523 family)